MEEADRSHVCLLEDLPNELFLKIFSYLNGADCILAFSIINKRFQSFLFEYCQQVDFENKTKSELDLILANHSTYKWKSLKLFNNEHTPGQIDYFFQQYPLLTYFIQLESLSLISLNPIDESLLIQLCFLTNLTSLKLGFICAQFMFDFDTSQNSNS
ncbi:hypothetical protein I4U23_012185 [Adineta vaga]|nr:hypothetical protein I4U23_012185 [Adineta vaga]